MTDVRPRTKVLFCIDFLLRGGTELQLIGLIERLDPARFEPWLLTIRQTDPVLVPAGCRHLAWDVPRLLAPGGVAALMRLARLLRRERFDVVQTFFQDSTILGGVAAWLAGVPVRLACFRDLGFWRTRLQELVLRPVYRRMTGYLCNAAAIRDEVAEHYGLDPRVITITPNGVDTDSLAWTEHVGPTTDVGIVGNLTDPVKRTDLFLDAVATVAVRNPQVRWHVVGDGDLRSRCEEQAVAGGLDDRVVFVGCVADVPAYLEQWQVGIICSDSEGLSNAIIEYMFKGCAVVATDVGGNPELVRDGDTGLLVPPDDAEALAAAVDRLIRDSQLRRDLAMRARRFVEQRFSWERCLAIHEEVWVGQFPSGR